MRKGRWQRGSGLTGWRSTRWACSIGLVLRAAEARAPGADEVQIAVEAAGLNFLDVLLAMGVMAAQ